VSVFYSRASLPHRLGVCVTLCVGVPSVCACVRANPACIPGWWGEGGQYVHVCVCACVHVQTRMHPPVCPSAHLHAHMSKNNSVWQTAKLLTNGNPTGGCLHMCICTYSIDFTAHLKYKACRMRSVRQKCPVHKFISPLDFRREETKQTAFQAITGLVNRHGNQHWHMLNGGQCACQLQQTM
jgi:hypothetical protein